MGIEPSAIVLDVGKYCLNECGICGIYGSFDSYGIGQNIAEENALVNILDAFSRERVVSGHINDPLSNLKGLDIILKEHKLNELVLNPSSFITNEARKPASRIPEDEMEKILARDYDDLDETTQEMMDTVRRFSVVSVSDTRYQAFSENMAKYANMFLQKHYPDNDFHSKSIRRRYVMTPHSSEDFFKGFSEEILPIVKVEKIFSCDRSPEELILHFKKEDDDIYLMQNFCAQVNSNQYVSINTGLNVDDLGTISPKKLRRTLIENRLDFFSSTLGYYLDPHTGGDKEELDMMDLAFTRKIRFNRYIMLASELISEKTARHVDMFSGAMTNDNDMTNKVCYMCSKVAKELKENGISRKEWHNYLESNR